MTKDSFDELAEDISEKLNSKFNKGLYDSLCVITNDFVQKNPDVSVITMMSTLIGFAITELTPVIEKDRTAIKVIKVMVQGALNGIEAQLDAPEAEEE